MYKKTEYQNIYKNIRFGLYNHEIENLEQAKKEILTDFKKEYETTIKQKLKENGLKLHKLEYESPHAYNYEDDDLITTISIENPEKLVKKVEQNKERIQKALDQNKSYDGYIATTAKTINEVIREIKEKNTLDILALQELLNLDCSSFNPIEHIKTI